MIAHGMIQAAHDRQLIRHTGGTWQVLTDLDASHAAGDGPKLTTYLAWGVGLHIPRVEVTGPAIVENQNARFRPAGPARRWPSASRFRAGCLGLQQPRQAEAQTPETPDPQELATGSQTVPKTDVVQSFIHGGSPRRLMFEIPEPARG